MPLTTSQTFPGFFLILFPFFFSLSHSCTFTITNNCPDTIWPGTLAGSGTPQLPTTGFRLDSGQSVRLPSTPGWSGRIWARTGCTFDELGAGTCQTGDCGGRLECNGNGAAPPTSLFEITLGKGNDKDFYDVSIVDGYNLPLIAAPRGVYGACNATGCASDINMGCPKELQVMGGGNEGSVVGCKSACEAFGLDQYCCSGQFANPTTCQPSSYSSIFKRACPRAYSYAFDDGTSTFTCKAYDYAIIFCPNGNGTRTSNDALAPPRYQEPGRGNDAFAPPSYQVPASGNDAFAPPRYQVPGSGDDALTPPRYQVPDSGKVVQVVSSSNALLPIPPLILLLIIYILS